ncbi:MULTISPECIES: citrate synthase [Cupriavidus]|uniref:citrate synthase (unknown stereospecificity) n=1 Tax=Cupriavidus alkaliphilus TaxID=942866 RepID=A0A7W4VE78_9BURK|nr:MULTISPECIES: citrate synthase [Cupriavidus]MBB3009956.1 citrate synthase [Cupriavidus alkaliphilus]GLC96671.1 citrate synthase [Cupriavidus sp. TA19]
MKAEHAVTNDALYLSAEEAASLLNINVATLYAYVGRKGIRSSKVDGSRSRRYWAADIERLLAERGTASQSPTPHWPAISTSITLLTEKGLYYRGRPATDLADHATLEEVAEWMWETPGAFDRRALPFPEVARRVIADLQHLGPMAQALALFPILEQMHPHAYDLSKTGYARTGADTLRSYAAVLTQSEPVAGPLHQHLTKGLRIAPKYEDMVRRMLVLSVDHEFTPMTYAVRTTANTGITPYAAAVCGLLASRGRRISAGRVEQAVRLLSEIAGAKDPCEPVLARFREGEAIAGFDRNVHGVEDPRAAHLMKHMMDVFAHDVDFRRLTAVIDLVRDLTDQPPAFVLLAAFLGRKFEMHGNELAIVGLGRMVGWIAHASEQYHQGPHIRARANYVGLLPKAEGNGVFDDQPHGKS